MTTMMVFHGKPQHATIEETYCCLSSLRSTQEECDKRESKVYGFYGKHSLNETHVIVKLCIKCRIYKTQFRVQ